MSIYNLGVIAGEGKTEIKELELHQPEGRQVLVKVHSCAICTLEQRIYQGVMKRYPFAGGHEMSGTVEAVGDKVKRLKVGENVAMRMLTSCGECYYCRSGHENLCVDSFKTAIHQGFIGPGGMAEYMLVDAPMVYPLEADMDLSHAALAEPLACCVHSIDNADIRLGNDVVIIGTGIMGALHIQLARLKGARVIVCEVDKARMEVAKKMGAHVVIDSGKEDAVERVKELTGGRGADAVVSTVALPEVARQGVAMAGKLGRVVFYSSIHPDEPISLSANRVHSDETVITGSVNPTRRDFLTSVRLLSFGLVDVSALISDSVPLSDPDRAFQRAIDPSTYRVLVRCNQ